MPSGKPELMGSRPSNGEGTWIFHDDQWIPKETYFRLQSHPRALSESRGFKLILNGQPPKQRLNPCKTYLRKKGKRFKNLKLEIFLLAKHIFNIISFWVLRKNSWLLKT